MPLSLKGVLTSCVALCSRCEFRPTAITPEENRRVLKYTPPEEAVRGRRACIVGNCLCGFSASSDRLCCRGTSATVADCCCAAAPLAASVMDLVLLASCRKTASDTSAICCGPLLALGSDCCRLGQETAEASLQDRPAAPGARRAEHDVARRAEHDVACCKNRSTVRVACDIHAAVSWDVESRRGSQAMPERRWQHGSLSRRASCHQPALAEEL